MVAGQESRPDYLELLSRIAVLIGFVIAATVYIVAPLLALSWRHQPFPGFLVQATLIVSASNGENWSGRAAGIDPMHHVVRVDGQPVATGEDFEQVIARGQIGDEISVFTHRPDGSEHLFPSVALMAFPTADLLRMFGVPYLIGIAYLLIGVWIYWLRGKTRPGRALAFMCIVAAITLGTVFDIFSTHAGTLLYTSSIAFLGGALISLAWRFPEEWTPVQYRPLVLALPYTVSVALSLWGLYAYLSRSDPWALMSAWFGIYYYTALGILILLGMMVYRSWRGATLVVRRQARVILAGSFLAFAPITVWFLLPLLGVVTFYPLIVFPALIFFPISVALAILRLRLWEVDTLVNKAFVYGLATAILAGVFAALSSLGQKTFVLITGERSDAAIVLVTLIIAAAFTPLKSVIQRMVDRGLKGEQDDVVALRSFGDEVRAHTEMSDTVLLTKRLLTEAVQTLQAESGAVSLVTDGRYQIVHTHGKWRGDCRMSVLIRNGDQRYGLLQLGPHADNIPYTKEDGRALKYVVEQVGAAISFYGAPQNLDQANGSPTGSGHSRSNEATLDAQAQREPMLHGA